MKKSTANELDLKILELIRKGVDQPCPDLEFNTLALELFRYQYAQNLPYQRYCNQLQTKPNQIKHWKEIPCLPTSAFKEERICCFPRQKEAKVFFTSGTTLKTPGRHHLENLILYETSLLINFKAHFDTGEKKWPLLILTPSASEAPHSSLCHMMEVLQREIGREENPYYIQKSRFLMTPFQKRLRYFETSQEPIILLGTALSFLHFLNHANQNQWSFKLAPGSRIMETGGYKGKTRELPKSELYKRMSQVFGVPKNRIINEYGMTEMGSQFYDNTLHPISRRGRGHIHKNIPPWARTRVIDAQTLQELPRGKVGLLQHYDLTNRSSVMAILTEDIGVKIGDGFEILGRSLSAEPRGCSRGVDEWIK